MSTREVMRMVQRRMQPRTKNSRDDLRKIEYKVRLSETEKAMLDECAEDTSGADFLRRLLYDFYFGDDEIATKATSDGAQEIVNAINKVGNNINQISRELHRRNKNKNSEILSANDWQRFFKGLVMCHAEIVKANEYLLAQRGVSGTPKNFEGRGNEL